MVSGQASYGAGMTDTWATLASPFIDGSYATIKGQVRTFVLHEQLVSHLPPPPAAVLDVGGGAGHQSLPLARLGYHVTLLDPSPAMLARASERLAGEPEQVRARVTLLEGSGEDAVELTGGQRFDAVLCLGVLLYLDDPQPLVHALCGVVRPGGVVSIMTLAPHGPATRAVLERRWSDALTLFDVTREVGPLGVDTRADSVAGLTALLQEEGAELEAWYGVLLFSEWLALPSTADVRQIGEVELAASRRDPYRQAARSFHLIGRTTVTPA